ncbi:YlbG family protein [Kroppenstedtia pulmonis]|uniref:YlbG family protein n=1 Tax=Kroppenstedtia pulmonis TaxID=1380685 RepID=A0A7D3Y1B3_9BACL|nr:YlbG family protein [Kroppenstedtia pulmonis]QKG85160.1 YlbG family protein [Kroppenstedtia pulmonis]
MSMKIAERLGLAVWVKDLKAARSLGRMGNVHYVSKRLKYVFLYIDGRKADQTINRIERMPLVTRVERSFRRELATEFPTEKYQQNFHSTMEEMGSSF